MPNKASNPIPPAIMFSVDTNEMDTFEKDDTYVCRTSAIMQCMVVMRYVRMYVRSSIPHSTTLKITTSHCSIPIISLKQNTSIVGLDYPKLVRLL